MEEKKCKWWVIEGGEEYIYRRAFDRSEIDRSERKEKERARERESKKKESIYIVIGWERQTSIFFLTNIDRVFSFFFSLIDKSLQNKGKVSFIHDWLFHLSMEFDRQWFILIGVFFSLDQLWLKFDRLSSCGQSHLSFRVHLMISFSHLFDLFSIDRRT